MSDRTRPLDDPRVPVRAKLAASWTSFMFLYIYVDYYHLYRPGILEDISSGIVFEFVISPGLMTGFLALLSIPALMIVLSMVLPSRASRIANLVAASLFVPVTVFNAVGESWEWAPFYALSIGLELLLLAFILRSAATWPRVSVGADPRMPIASVR